MANKTYIDANIDVGSIEIVVAESSSSDTPPWDVNLSRTHQGVWENPLGRVWKFGDRIALARMGRADRPGWTALAVCGVVGVDGDTAEEIAEKLLRNEV